MSDLVEQARLGSRLPSPKGQRHVIFAAGTSITDVADELGVHPVTVQRWLAGTREPRGALRAAYAKLLADLAEAVSS